MPVIPQPHVHLKAALDAIDEHAAHHQARIAHHQGELDALEQLRGQYQDVLGQVAPDEPAPVAVTFAQVLSGDIDRVIAENDVILPHPIGSR